MLKAISGSKLADCSKGLFSQLDLLARESHLIARSSAKFSAKGFVLSLFKAVLTGKASFNQIAANLISTLSRYGDPPPTEFVSHMNYIADHYLRNGWHDAGMAPLLPFPGSRFHASYRHRQQLPRQTGGIPDSSRWT